MTFWGQQALTFAVGIAAAIAAEAIYGGVQIRVGDPNGQFFLVWLYQFSLAVVFSRLFAWLAWDSERGRHMLAAMRLNLDTSSSGLAGMFKRWFFHIDRNGKDLDARTR